MSHSAGQPMNPSSDPSPRHLAAVWFADIVGYSSLASRDERAALRLVEVLQRTAREQIERFRGRLVKFLGDGVFAEFTSTEAAVRAALALQREFALRTAAAGVPGALRIGVHVGDVASGADGDLYGDGINLAARLEGQAEPGQVLVSESVWQQLRPRPEFRFRALGERELKGALERVPVFAVHLEGESASPAAPPATAPPARHERSRAARRPGPSLRLPLAALVLLALAASGWLVWRRAAAPETRLDARVVAVLPFRVAGAEPGLAYLREGMLDLLATKLTGEGGPRAVDPRTLTSAWRRATDDGTGDLSREEALALARGLGAGRLVLGEVVSLPGRVVLTASLSYVASGRTDEPVSVEGPVDSLPALVDRLVAGMLSVGAGEGERLASLTTTSLPALRLYLEGQADYRSGRYDAALSRFSRAIEIDSTFALAALMTYRMAGWVTGAGSPGNRDALALSWRHRDRLGGRDRAYLAAVAGSRYPGHTPGAERAATWEALVQARPDSPEAWMEWGDMLLHWGPLLGIPDSVALRRAADAFNRTLALDSMYLPALGHLFDIAAIRGDTAAARRYGELYLARDPVGLIADAVRNARAAQTRGMSAMPEIIARVDSVGGALRRYTLQYLSFHPETMPTALALADHLGSRIGDPEILRDVRIALVIMTLNRGRPTEAARYLSVLHRGGGIDSVGYLVAQLRSGLYEDGDPEAAARAAASLARHVEQSGNDSSDFPALCVLGQWRLARGETAAAAPLIERLHAFGNTEDSLDGAVTRLCAAALDTWRAVELDAPDAPARLARLDSLSTADFVEGRFTYEVNLILARLLEARGDRAGALRVLGRYPVYAPAYAAYRSTYLRNRGRIAASVGDTAAAIDTYRYYLALRTDPEPALRPEVERVRAEYLRLTGGRAP